MLHMYLHDQYVNYRKQLDHMNTLIIEINEGFEKREYSTRRLFLDILVRIFLLIYLLNCINKHHEFARVNNLAERIRMNVKVINTIDI
jgi:hypothetical protein